MDQSLITLGVEVATLPGSGNQNSQAEIETHMIYGANHKIECFSFWFAIKVGVGIINNKAAEYCC